VKEFNHRFNSNKFIDKRIGEKSKFLTEDDKMLLRFKNVQKVNKKLIYSPNHKIKNLSLTLIQIQTLK